MGGKKKHVNPTQPAQNQVCNQSSEEKRFVNLLHVYTFYKKKFRRLTKKELKKLLRHGRYEKQAAVELCKKFMKAKQIPDEVDFEKNIGFLSVPRFMPLVALVAERAGYNAVPSLVKLLDFSKTPERFQKKFPSLMVIGFWFLGRVISDSLSVKDQVNRGNVFNFLNGDLGFWWAGVKILDWNYYVNTEPRPENCYSFVTKDPPKYRLYTNRAIVNMHKHPLYFLSETDWLNYTKTIKSVGHVKLSPILSSYGSISNETTPSFSSYEDPISDISSLTSEASVNMGASREFIH